MSTMKDISRDKKRKSEADGENKQQKKKSYKMSTDNFNRLIDRANSYDRNEVLPATIELGEMAEAGFRSEIIYSRGLYAIADSVKVHMSNNSFTLVRAGTVAIRNILASDKGKKFYYTINAYNVPAALFKILQRSQFMEDEIIGPAVLLSYKYFSEAGHDAVEVILQDLDEDLFDNLENCYALDPRLVLEIMRNLLVHANRWAKEQILRSHLRLLVFASEELRKKEEIGINEDDVDEEEISECYDLLLQIILELIDSMPDFLRPMDEIDRKQTELRGMLEELAESIDEELSKASSQLLADYFSDCGPESSLSSWSI